MDPLSRNQSARAAQRLWGRYRSWVALVAGTVLLLAVGATAVNHWRSQLPTIDLTASSHGSTPATVVAGVTHDDAVTGATPAVGVIVHVAGRVRNPGVVTVPAGARVDDAIRAAGGFSKSAAADAINLAAVLTDGQQVYVPSREEVDQGVGGQPQGTADGWSGAGSSSPNGLPAGPPGGVGPLVDVNSASAQQLETLPGIGPATSAKIIADRSANGPYRTLGDLTRVSGIGEKRVGALEGLAVAR